jgi:6-phosphogluconolactonase (cycloisomerase 2 family)
MKMGLLRRMAAVLGLLALVWTTGCAGFWVAVNKSNNGGNTANDYVYVANPNGSATAATLAGFAVGAGTLTAVPGSPYTLGFTPTSVAINPADSIVFVSGHTSTGVGVIYAFSIGTGGGLSALNNGYALSSAGEEISMDISPDGQWLMGLNANNTSLDEYGIAYNTSTQALSLSGPSSMPYYNLVTGTISASQVKVAPDGDFVFASLGTAGDLVYQLNTSTGVLTALSPLPPISTTTSDNALAVSSGSSYLYIARSGTNGGLAVYTISSTGALQEVTGSPLATGSQPTSVVVNKAGTDIYVANQNSGTISQYGVVTSTGAVSPLSPATVSAVSAPWAMAVDNSGDYLLSISEAGSPDLTMYSDSAGTLTFSTSTPTGNGVIGPVAIAATH